MSRAYSRGTQVLRSFRLILVLALFLAGGVRAIELSDAELVKHIEDQVESGFYIGVIVGFVDGDDITVQSFGETRKGSGVAPNELTVFEISSVSKVILATALAYLTVTDSVDLAGLANDYLPADAQFGNGSGDHRKAGEELADDGLPGRDRHRQQQLDRTRPLLFSPKAHTDCRREEHQQPRRPAEE